MKAAFNDNPGLTGFIDEVTNAVLTSEEFRKKLEQVDDVFEVLNNKMSDLDLGAKWGDDLDENLQQIIDGYNKEMDAADKAAEKAEAAEARKQQAAAATVERLEANNRRASATYEELQAELESYIAKLEEARKAGDNVAQADALKNIQDLGRRIKTAGDAGQLTSTQVKGAGGADYPCGNAHPGHVQRPPRGDPVHPPVRNHHQNGDGAAGLGHAADPGADRRHYRFD